MESKFFHSVRGFSTSKLAFVFLLMFAFLGVSPLSSDPTGMSSNIDGSFVRQLVLIFILFIAIAKCNYRNLASELGYFWPILLVLLVSGFSTMTSHDPSLSLKRWVIFLIVSFSLIALVVKEGSDSLLATFYGCLQFAVIVSVLLAIFLPSAVHTYNEFLDDELIGSWKGIFIHKNQAAPVAVIFIIMMASKGLWSKFDTLVFALAVIFVFFTNSKSSLFIGVICLFVLLIFKRNYTKTFADHFLSFVLALAILIGGFFLFCVFSDVQYDPAALTGRGTIWNGLSWVVQDNPVLGLGYGALWGGEDFVLSNYYPSEPKWLESLTHSHNGYYEVMASMGIVGYLFALVLFFIFPIVTLKRCVAVMDSGKIVFYTTFLIFFILHNIFETDLFNSTDPRWVMFLSIYIVLISDARKYLR